MLGAWDSNVGAGGHMSSKLAQRVAVNGLCKNYMAFNTNYHDTGLFGVYAVAAKDQPVGACAACDDQSVQQICQIMMEVVSSASLSHCVLSVCTLLP